MAATKVLDPPGPLQTQRLSNGNRILLRDLMVRLAGGTRIVVPTGFETDFSSIPWIARGLVHWSKVDIAGVVHDFLYWCPQQGIDRRRADDIWWEVAGAGQHSANWAQQWAGWVGLRGLGWLAHGQASRARAAGNGRKCKPTPPPTTPTTPTTPPTS